MLGSDSHGAFPRIERSEESGCLQCPQPSLCPLMSVYSRRVPGPAPRVKRALHSLCSGLSCPARAARGVRLLLGELGSFLISLMAAEPCPSSSPCPPVSHQPANPEDFLSPPQSLASHHILTVADPSSVLHLGEVFFLLFTGSRNPFCCFSLQLGVSPRDLQVSYTLLSPFSTCFLGNPSEQCVG